MASTRPDGSARVRMRWNGDARDVSIRGDSVRIRPPRDGRADTLIEADERVWRQLAEDAGAGLQAFGTGKLRMRGNLHVGRRLPVGHERRARRAAPALRPRSRPRVHGGRRGRPGRDDPRPRRHEGVVPPDRGGARAAPATTRSRSTSPGSATRTSRCSPPTTRPSWRAPRRRFLDARGIESAHFVGNSLGGRVTLELGLAHPERTRKLALLACSLAWKRRPAWARYLSLARPELGLIQPAPRPVVEESCAARSRAAASGWAAAGIDEFVRSYCTPRGRAAFYAAARHILLEQSEEFWERLGTLEREALFVWGRQDGIVPLSFARHVREALPAGEARRARLRPRSADRAAGGDRGGAQALPERRTCPRTGAGSGAPRRAPSPARAPRRRRARRRSRRRPTPPARGSARPRTSSSTAHVAQLTMPWKAPATSMYAPAAERLAALDPAEVGAQHEPLRDRHADRRDDRADHDPGHAERLVQRGRDDRVHDQAQPGERRGHPRLLQREVRAREQQADPLERAARPPTRASPRRRGRSRRRRTRRARRRAA